MEQRRRELRAAVDPEAAERAQRCSGAARNRGGWARGRGDGGSRVEVARERGSSGSGLGVRRWRIRAWGRRWELRALGRKTKEEEQRRSGGGGERAAMNSIVLGFGKEREVWLSYHVGMNPCLF